MLPEADFVFLDELFNANSAILNNLLTVLNERVYRRGAEIHHLPLLSLFSASNQLPEDEALRALFDRFLLRCPVENLRRESMPRLLAAGWELERSSVATAGVSSENLRDLGQPNTLLVRAFSLARRLQRSAGAFCAILCGAIPAVLDPPLLVSAESFQLEVGASEPLFTRVQGEAATLSPEVFEARVLHALFAYSFEEILHWLRYSSRRRGAAGP
jgi:hypothetical protein